MNNISLAECFTETFLVRHNKLAISFLRDGVVETQISYTELHRHSNRMANTFLELGVEKGDRVILFIPKSLIFVVAHLALQKIGAIAVPLNPGFKKSEMAYLLQDADAKVILLEPGAEALIQEIDSDLNRLVIDTRKPYQDIDIVQKASEDFGLRQIDADDP
jgi:malonyl-CoA/methylmalonyl-CoA synthetase